MVGFTGRMMGGGLGVGCSFVTCLGWTSLFLVEELLRLSGLRSMTIPLNVFCEAGGGMMPSVIRTRRRTRLIATASAKPDARRLSGCRSYGEGRR